MAEFIGSTISLISKRDIRYVGTLHEISSENATVALKNVRSFGTEGRKPGEEVAANPTVYEFILFKGSDVKDLRIEEGPKEPELPKQQMPDDPAILESTRKTTPGGNAPQPTGSAGPQNPPNLQQQPPFPPPGPNSRGPYPPQMPYPPYGFPPPDQRFGFQGFPPGPPPPGYPRGPYGPIPPWNGPGGPGALGGPGGPGGPGPGAFGPPPPGQFPQQPIGPPGQRRSPSEAPPSAPSGIAGNRTPNQTTGQPGGPAAPAPAPPGVRGPAPPTDTKPGVEAALAPPSSVKDESSPEKGKTIPAVPLPNAAHSAVAANGAIHAATLAAQGSAAGTAQTMAERLSKPVFQAPSNGNGLNKKSLEDANRDARAAVAQAMAKLTTGKVGLGATSVDALTQQVQNLNTSANGGPGGRRTSQSRGARGNKYRDQGRKMEVPKDDFDFESSNAKFNKHDLVKEAIATGSPITSPVDGASPGEAPASSSAHNATYNKNTSFFDNISSEIKERSEGTSEPLGGREFRNEERRKNVETFGQGSVDSGYRGRGRGRGRGGFRGRGRGRGARGGSGIVTAES